jgi:hypothetical protein
LINSSRSICRTGASSADPEKRGELIGATKPQEEGLEAREGVEGVTEEGEGLLDSTDNSTASVEPSTFIKEVEKPSSKTVKV